MSRKTALLLFHSFPDKVLVQRQGPQLISLLPPLICSLSPSSFYVPARCSSIYVSGVQCDNPGQYVPTSGSPYDAWPTLLTLFITHTHTNAFSPSHTSTYHPSLFLFISSSFKLILLWLFILLQQYQNFQVFFHLFDVSDTVSMVWRVNRESD